MNDDLKTQIRIALGELGATWEDPELIVQNILEIFKKEKAQATTTAKREALREVRETLEGMMQPTMIMERALTKGGGYPDFKALGYNQALVGVLTHLESELTV